MNYIGLFSMFYRIFLFSKKLIYYPNQSLKNKISSSDTGEFSSSFELLNVAK